MRKQINLLFKKITLSVIKDCDINLLEYDFSKIEMFYIEKKGSYTIYLMTKKSPFLFFLHFFKSQNFQKSTNMVKTAQVRPYVWLINKFNRK